MGWLVGWVRGFNVGQNNAVAIVESLGIFPKGDPETIFLAILTFSEVVNPSLCEISPEVSILQKTWKILHPRKFYMQQTSIVYMVVFDRAWNPSLPVSKPIGLSLFSVVW